ncbi:ClpP/crotonase-like domain-containing protein, partial [Hyaloraphidium curvatum]
MPRPQLFGTPPVVTLSRLGPLFLVAMHDPTPSRALTPNLMRAMLSALDAVEDVHDREGRPPAALVGFARNKISSNGADLPSLARMGPAYLAPFTELALRILAFRMPTVAAVNGHCYAGAVGLALAFDYRVAHPSRSTACMNEIDLPPAWKLFEASDDPAGMQANVAEMLARRMGPAAVRDFMYGLKFKGEELARCGFADELDEDVVGAAVRLAERTAPKARAGPAY